MANNETLHKFSWIIYIDFYANDLMHSMSDQAFYVICIAAGWPTKSKYQIYGTIYHILFLATLLSQVKN